MPEMNEWTFSSEAKKLIERILAENPSLPFSEARVEEGAGVGRKRNDLTLYDRDGRCVLTGEVRFPDSPGGQSPCSDALVGNAFEKANATGVEYFFTWNVNQLYLWRTFEAGRPVSERDFEHLNVTSIANRGELKHPLVQGEIEGALRKFLHTFARILEGAETLPSRPLDEKFIRVLESALELPILQTQSALAARYSKDRKFARDLDSWMRDAQGWLISTDPQILRDNLERAAKFSCYVLVNKIVFHQARGSAKPCKRFSMRPSASRATTRPSLTAISETPCLFWMTAW